MKTKVYKLLFVIVCLLSSFLPNGTMTMLASNSLTTRGDTVVSDLSTITPPTLQMSAAGWIASNLKYPVVAEENGVQGNVVVSFVVEIDGSLSNIHIEKSVDPSLDKEAMRLVRNMPKWTPGYDKNGKPVRVKYSIPVNFRLQ